MVDLTKRQYLRFQEVCDLLGISRRTLYLWTQKGRLEAKVIGGGRYISVAEYLRFTTGQDGKTHYPKNSVQAHAQSVP